MKLVKINFAIFIINIYNLFLHFFNFNYNYKKYFLNGTILYLFILINIFLYYKKSILYYKEFIL